MAALALSALPRVASAVSFDLARGVGAETDAISVSNLEVDIGLTGSDVTYEGVSFNTVRRPDGLAELDAPTAGFGLLFGLASLGAMAARR